VASGGCHWLSRVSMKDTAMASRDVVAMMSETAYIAVR
jgi:hypothetical protein